MQNEKYKNESSKYNRIKNENQQITVKWVSDGLYLKNNK